MITVNFFNELKELVKDYNERKEVIQEMFSDILERLINIDKRLTELEKK